MSITITGATAAQQARMIQPPARITTASISPQSLFDARLFPFQGIVVTDVTSLPVRWRGVITGKTLLKSALGKATVETGRSFRFTPAEIIRDPFAVARSLTGAPAVRVFTDPIRSGVPGMSLSIKAAKAGVPLSGGISPQLGIFGSIGRFLGGAARTIGGIVGGPVGAGLRTLGGIGSRPGVGPATTPFVGPSVPLPRPPVLGLPLPGRPPIVLQPVQQVPVPGPRGTLERFFPGGATGMMGCPSGFHPNKSSYFLQSGEFVPAGSRCVRNRRRNPLNPRALDRAIGRITSAKRASRKMSRISIRKPPCPK